MSRKVRVLISALVIALLLTVGATATVMAEGEDEDTTTVTEEETEGGFLGRVADILGIEREDLVSAFEQARQEIYEEAFINRLNEAVVEGRITQEQADEIIKWWEQRPDDAIIKWWEQRPDDAIREWWELKPEVIKPGMFKHNLTFRFRAMPKFHMRKGLGKWFCPELPEQTD